MELKKGQKIKCIKSWKLVSMDKNKEIVAGKSYEIHKTTNTTFSIMVMVEEMMLTWMGTVPMLQMEEMCFMKHEFSTYFEDTQKKCDCGFIPNISAAHYRWCSSQELVA